MTHRSSIAAAWLLGIGTVIAVHYRAQSPAYMSIHRWMADHAIPQSVRNFDSLLWYTAAALLGAAFASRAVRRSISEILCMNTSRRGWAKMVLLALMPMVAGGAVLGLYRAGESIDLATAAQAILKGVVRAPWSEELLFRGLLVAVPAACLTRSGRRVWMHAIPAALLFGLTHVTWTRSGIVDGWPNLLVTFIGGLWYAWLLVRWRSIWAPMALHAGMNLGWLLASASGGAGGGVDGKPASRRHHRHRLDMDPSQLPRHALTPVRKNERRTPCIHRPGNFVTRNTNVRKSVSPYVRTEFS
ncbi:MAG: CPBP family intramembrane metalloprotease [Planctomycetes bacterium]|nr:CPBP family intramembrane metalloprotease [Planctomycetota bacterium]